ncbi:response regulator [Paenibacillus whitsoniae]|uniref:Response regulator n=1 Tax=Paenibacillus whitsoniae TaxID=2496558 RepID=A0A3S0IEL0_9BACL|nr:response regulator [Paenibacillus whitsoniae]RTE11214.1 response regulator [Paenibacillus whitsoniae]
MLRIAIVDDEERIRFGLGKIIGKASKDYHIAGLYADGLEALRELPADMPDVVITDIQMPGMNGLDLIERLHQSSPGVSFIVLSGYNEFEYARQALRFGVSDYLLKPVDKQELYAILARLHAAIESQRQRQQAELEETLRKLLAQDSATDSLLAQVPAVWCGKPITVIAVKSDSPMERPALEVWEQETITSCPQLKVIPLSRFEVCVLFAHQEMPEQGRCGQAKALTESLMDRLSGSLSAGIGPSAPDVSQLGAACQEALRVCEYALYSPYRTQTLCACELPAEPGLVAADKLEKRLRPHLELLDMPKIRETLQAEFVSLAQVKPERRRLMEACAKWVYFMEREVPEFTEAAAAALGGELSAEVLFGRHQRFSDIQAQFIRSVLDVLAKAKDIRDESENRVIDKVKRLIAEDYRNEIELQRLADQVFLTPSYLSKFFKSETGQTLTDYLIGIRIERAKELLKHRADLKSYEVGENVGYPDPAYFNKIFKRVVGLTPKEYRDTVR